MIKMLYRRGKVHLKITGRSDKNTFRVPINPYFTGFLQLIKIMAKESLNISDNLL
jgi:hypothetical protein